MRRFYKSVNFLRSALHASKTHFSIHIRELEVRAWVVYAASTAR